MKPIAILLFVALNLTSFPIFGAEAESFSVSLPATGITDPDQQTALITQLKKKAVTDWLREYLGPTRFEAFSKWITPAFAERYIQKFQFGRSPVNPEEVLLTGEIDANALRGWVRVTDIKRGGTVIKPLLIFSAQLDTLKLLPERTAASTRDTKLGEVLLDLTTGLFQKYNARLSMLAGGGVPPSPPANENDWKSIRSAVNSENNNLVLWLNLSPCKECSGARLDLFLYAVKNGRIALARSEEIALSAGDLSQSTPAVHLKNIFNNTFRQLSTELDSQVANGLLFGNTFRLTVEGLDSIAKYRRVEVALNKKDFVLQLIVKRTEPRLVEFELLTPLASEELSKQVQAATYEGFHLKAVRMDPGVLVVKYVK